MREDGHHDAPRNDPKARQQPYPWMARYQIALARVKPATRKLQRGGAKDRADQKADYGEHDSHCGHD
jgi:hypothetical protein